MPANWELQLISSIVTGDDGPDRLAKAMEHGIETEVFGNAEARAMWSWITYYTNRPNVYGQIPSAQQIRERFNNKELPKPQAELEALCDLVATRNTRRKVDKAWEKYQKEQKDDHASAITTLTNTLLQMQEQTASCKDAVFSEVGPKHLLEIMERLELNDGMTGIPLPWDRMNKATGGIQPGDYILMYAIPKSMKTWVGLYIAIFIALTGRRVLVYSREMTWDTTLKRIGCLLAKVDYTKFKTNTLTPKKKAAVLEAAESFAAASGTDLIFTDGDRPDGSAAGPGDIRRKIEMYKPQFVLLDSAYMLEMPGAMGNQYDWRQMSLVNRECKQISKRTNIPILAILQENERAAIGYKGKSRGTASIAMNTSAVQDCDLSIRVVYHKLNQELSLHLPAARETRDPGFTINAKAAYDFTYAHDTLWEVGDDMEAEDKEGTKETAAALKESVEKLPSMTEEYRNQEAPKDDG